MKEVLILNIMRMTSIPSTTNAMNSCWTLMKICEKLFALYWTYTLLFIILISINPHQNTQT